jgi:hypothetical protein
VIRLRRVVSSLSLRRPRVVPRSFYVGFFGRQSGTGTGFSLSASVFRCQYHSSVALHTDISSEG